MQQSLASLPPLACASSSPAAGQLPHGERLGAQAREAVEAVVKGELFKVVQHRQAGGLGELGAVQAVQGVPAV